MSIPLPGGTVSDSATDQNLRAIAAHLPFPNVLELREQGAPPVPSEGGVRIYAAHHEGKTRILALFHTGEPQVIAEEP